MIQTIGPSIQKLGLRFVSAFCLLAGVFLLAAWLRVGSADKLTIFILALVPVAGVILFESIPAKHSDLGASTFNSVLPLQDLPYRAYSDFLRGVAHEMNNPLTSVLACLDLALRESSESKVIGHLTTAMREARRLGSLVRTLLTIQIAELDLKDVYDLNAVIERAFLLKADDLAHWGIKLEKNLGRALPNVRGNPELLLQALTNVIQNAITAMKDCQGTRTIKVTTDAVGDGDLLLEVSDTGPGIPKAVRRELFQRPITGTGGTGLGLMIVKRIVDLTGGAVDLRSDLGIGTTVSITLPAARDRQDIVQEESKGHAGFRALVADDDESVRNLMVSHLEGQGYLVDVAADLRVARRLIEERAYDVILLDVVMPGSTHDLPNGLELLEMLRATDPTISQKTILVTGYRETLSRSKTQHIRFVEKPFTFEELDEALEKTVD